MYSPPGLHRSGHSLHLAYKCLGGSRSRKSRLVARRRLASSSSLCQEVMSVSAPCNTRLRHGAPSSIFACTDPYGSVNSECEPVVHRRAVCGSKRLEVVLETIHPILHRASLAWIFPPTSFPSTCRCSPIDMQVVSILTCTTHFRSAEEVTSRGQGLLGWGDGPHALPLSHRYCVNDALLPKPSCCSI